jgi:hypothetical protein
VLGRAAGRRREAEVLLEELLDELDVVVPPQLPPGLERVREDLVR